MKFFCPSSSSSPLRPSSSPWTQACELWKINSSLTFLPWTFLILYLWPASESSTSTMAMAMTTESELTTARSKWIDTSNKYGPLSYSFGLEETTKINGEIVVEEKDGSEDDDFIDFFDDDIPTIVRVDDLNSIIDICSNDMDYFGEDDFEPNTDINGDGLVPNSLTVEGFFDRIETVMTNNGNGEEEEEKAGSVDVVFEPVFGYPLVVVFTYDTQETTTGIETVGTAPALTTSTTTKTYEFLSFMIYNVLQSDLDLAKQRWESSYVLGYNFTQRLGCNNCSPYFRIPKQVSVQGEEIVSVIDETSGLEEPVEQSWQMTVSGLFDQAQQSIDNKNYRIEFSVDEEYGFLTYLFWNHHPGLADGSLSFTSWNLSVTNTIQPPQGETPFQQPPVQDPQQDPTHHPSFEPSMESVFYETDQEEPTSVSPSESPSAASSESPSSSPSSSPSTSPSPSSHPSDPPSTSPEPSSSPSGMPSQSLTNRPNSLLSSNPSGSPFTSSTTAPFALSSPSSQTFPTAQSSTSLNVIKEMMDSSNASRIHTIMSHPLVMILFSFVMVWIVFGFDTAMTLAIVYGQYKAGRNVIAFC